MSDEVMPGLLGIFLAPSDTQTSEKDRHMQFFPVTATPNSQRKA